MLVTDLKCFFFWMAAVLVRTYASEQTPHSVSPDVQDLRDRYSASAVVRDLDHIKKDLSKVLHLAQVGELNTEETTFYFMRMHDFDDNNMLDGLEIMQAFEHLMEHNNQTFDHNSLEGMVDNLLTVDTNQDGFVSYPEWVSYVQKAHKEEPKGHQEQ